MFFCFSPFACRRFLRVCGAVEFCFGRFAPSPPLRFGQILLSVPRQSKVRFAPFFKKPAPAYFVAKQKTPLSGCFFVSLLLLADVSFAYAEPSNFVSLALLPPLRFARTNPATFLIKQSPFCYFKKTVGDAFVAKQRTPAKRVFFVLFDEKIRVFIRP